MDLDKLFENADKTVLLEQKDSALENLLVQFMDTPQQFANLKEVYENVYSPQLIELLGEEMAKKVAKTAVSEAITIEAFDKMEQLNNAFRQLYTRFYQKAAVTSGENV